MPKIQLLYGNISTGIEIFPWSQKYSHNHRNILIYVEIFPCFKIALEALVVYTLIYFSKDWFSGFLIFKAYRLT